MQVGLATPYKDKLEKTDKQVNVSLVIDNSGSMSGGKMEFVKNALLAFLKELEDGTNLSIIVFNSMAQIRQKRSEEHTSELQSRENLVCRLLLEKKK